MRVPFALAVVGVVGGCAGSAGPPLSPLGREHLRSGYRGALEGTAVVLPILDCTSTEVARIPNPTAREAEERVASLLWEKLALPGQPDPLDAEELPERSRLCRELTDNLDSGTNYVTASPAMREVLRDYFNKHAGRTWLVVAARWLWLGERVPGGASGVGVLEGRRRETNQLDTSLYIFSRSGDVAYRADLFCRPEVRPDGKGERFDCGGARFDKLEARVSELVEGFPRSVVERPAVVRLGGPVPMSRQPDPVIDLKNPGAVKLPDPDYVPVPLAEIQKPQKSKKPRKKSKR